MEFEMIRGILAELLKMDENEIFPNTEIDRDLGMNSLEMFSLMVKLEKAFEISLDIQIFLKMVCVKDIVVFIQQRKIYRG